MGSSPIEELKAILRNYREAYQIPAPFG